MPGAVAQVLQFAEDASATTISGAATWTAGEWVHVTLWGPDAFTDLIDNLGNTFTFIGSAIEIAIPTRVHHFYGHITTGGAATLTGRYFSDAGFTTPVSVTNRQMAACRISGVSGYQAGNQGTDTGSNPTTTLTAVCTTQPAFVLMVGVDYQSGTLTVGAGFTDVAFITGSGGGSSLDGRVQSKSVAATGAQGGNFGNTSFDRSVYVVAIFTEATAPVITAQPTNQTANNGATATFTIAATGATGYQWKKNTVDISGETGTSLDVTATYADQWAQFTCLVSNADGSTLSAVARLFVDWNTTGVGRRTRAIIGGGAIGKGPILTFARPTFVAGGGGTITGEVGSFTLSGQLASLEFNRLVAGAQGVFNFTGQAAATKKTFKVVAAFGAFALNGQAAALLRNARAVSAVASFSLNGQAATLIRSIALVSERGSFSLTGVAANLLLNRLLRHEFGQFSLFGQAAALRRSARLTADFGGFAFTGQQAGLNLARILVAERGQFTLTGQQASLIRLARLNGEHASFAFNGQQATLRTSGKIAGEVGAYSFTGQLASLKKNSRATGEHGSFALVGRDATLSVISFKILNAETGLCSLNGQQARLIRSAQVGSQGAAFTVAGQIARLLKTSVLPAFNGSFALNGQQVALRYVQLVLANGATFNLSGQPVTLLANRRLLSQFGAFNLTGQEANLYASSGYEPSPDRTFTVEPEQRLYLVEVEDRLYVVEIQDRTFTVQPEARTNIVGFEGA